MLGHSLTTQVQAGQYWSFTLVCSPGTLNRTILKCFRIRLQGKQEMCLLIQLHLPRGRHKDMLGLWILTESTHQGTYVRKDYQISKMPTYLLTFAQTPDNILHLFNCVYQIRGSQNPGRQHMSPAAFQLQPLTQAWAIPECSQHLPWDSTSVWSLMRPFDKLVFFLAFAPHYMEHSDLSSCHPCIPKAQCCASVLGRMTALASSILNSHLLHQCFSTLVNFFLLFYVNYSIIFTFLGISISFPLSSIVS